MTPLRQRTINDMTVRGLADSTMASSLRSVTRRVPSALVPMLGRAALPPSLFVRWAQCDPSARLAFHNSRHCLDRASRVVREHLGAQGTLLDRSSRKRCRASRRAKVGVRVPQIGQFAVRVPLEFGQHSAFVGHLSALRPIGPSSLFPSLPHRVGAASSLSTYARHNSTTAKFDPSR